MPKRFNKWFFSTLGLLAVTAPVSLAGAADLSDRQPITAPAFTRLPAVDGINGKVEIFGGGSDVYHRGLSSLPGFGSPFSTHEAWRGFGGGAGAISIPLGHDFGAQIDTLLSPWNNHTAAGGAGHVFWRDPSVAQLGVYGSGLYWGGRGGVSVGRVAGEGEAYFGALTIRGLIGAEFLGVSQPLYSPFGVTPFGAPYFIAGNAPTQPGRFFDKVTLSYYFTDDFALTVGHSYTGGRNAAVLGAEYLLPHSRGGATAASLFVEGRVGEKYADSVLGGLRIYFGGSDKTLIRRHREDDPPINLNNDFNTLINSFGSQPGVPLPLPNNQTATPPL